MTGENGIQHHRKAALHTEIRSCKADKKRDGSLNRPFFCDKWALRVLHTERLCIEQNEYHNERINGKRFDQGQTDDHGGHDLS